MGKHGIKTKARKPKRLHKKGSQRPDEENDTRQHKKTTKKTKQKFGVDALLEKAQECLDRFDIEVAQKFCHRALEIEPDNLKALETVSNILLETGDVDAAVQYLNRAVSLSPDGGHSKFLCLGQVLKGEEAIKCYQKAIDIMLSERSAHSENQTEMGAVGGEDVSNFPTLTEISSAYCSIVEIYMTDCCFEENAEQLCKDYIERAIEMDPDNPEAHHLKASFLTTIGNCEEAKESAEKGLSLWLPKLQAVQQGNLESDTKVDLVEVCTLSIQSRIAISQLLIELEEYDKANEVLDLLVDEDDEIAIVWYLLGWLNYLKGSDYYGNVKFYLNKAKRVGIKVQCDDIEMMNHIEELLTELSTIDEIDKVSDDDEDAVYIATAKDEEIESDSSDDEEPMEH